ncbi:MAG TPA: sigma-70 family RNA polymerase sigma factor [Candidatus Limnocylindrales bacterium]|nr:sigma-70 family RNA polymerase sigma factor [Candidatus Limnocylindrales bacterium]
MRAEVEQAIQALQDNQPGATEQALALLQQTVFSFSMKVCGQREDAEDTAQETLLRAISQLASFSSSKALAVWLYKVAKTQCLMSRRKSKFAPPQHLSLELLMPNPQELERLTAPSFAIPDKTLLRKEQTEQLHKAILKLPPDFRLILVLHDMEELSTKEVASVTGLREGTVRVRLHRARVFLRNVLAGAGHSTHRTTKSRSHQRSHCKQLFRELSDYLDGALDPSRCDALERHLPDCQPCKIFLSSLEHTVKELRRRQLPGLKDRPSRKMRTALFAEYRRAIQASAHAPRPGTPR